MQLHIYFFMNSNLYYIRIKKGTFFFFKNIQFMIDKKFSGRNAILIKFESNTFVKIMWSKMLYQIRCTIYRWVKKILLLYCFANFFWMIKYKCLFNYILQQNKLNITRIIFKYIKLHIMKQFSNEHIHMKLEYVQFICKL